MRLHGQATGQVEPVTPTRTGDPKGLRIGQVADRVGVNPKTIRYYEQIGLLPQPPRTDSGYRVYDEDAVEQLSFVRAAQGFGLTLDEIREVLAFRERGERPCDYVLTAVRRRADELDRRITELLALRQEMRNLIVHAEQQPDALVRICHLIEDRSASSK